MRRSPRREQEQASVNLETPEPRFANEAWRVTARRRRPANASDRAAYDALQAPGIVQDDRRSIVSSGPISGEALAPSLDLIFSARSHHVEADLLATRGERLVLLRTRMRFEFGAGGPVEVEYLSLAEIDGQARLAYNVLFDLADLDAAYAELDARYEAGEGAIHPPVASRLREALARRDWDAIAALCAPGFTEHDHRSLAVLGTTPSPEAWAASFRALLELVTPAAQSSTRGTSGPQSRG